jgi:hypothetical protein
MGDISFRLDIAESGDSWVVLCSSPCGSTMTTLPAPFRQTELEARLTAVEKSLVRSSARLVTRRAAAPERTAHEFGAELSQTLLTGDVRTLFARCRQRAREQGVDLRVLVNPQGPHVSRIPWEFAVDPDRLDDYLALRLPVARSPHLMEPVAPLRFEPPLRVLGVIARPVDLPELNAERERADLTRALGGLSSELVQIKWLAGDRWSDLADEIRSRPWHVLHFVGHGGFDEDSESGFLEFSDDQGNACPVLATDLGRLIAGNNDLRLVVLNACESAVTGAEGFFSSTAAKLMREGVPAVVAMQYEITDDAALAFSSSFYEGLARGLPVDRTVMLARESVKMTMRTLEWATPVLFLASDETYLFKAESRPTAVPSTSSPQEVPTAETGPAATDWLSTTRAKLGQLIRVGESGVSAASSSGAATPGTWGVTPSQSAQPSPLSFGEPTMPVRGAPAGDRVTSGEPVVPAASRVRTLPGAGACSYAAVGPRDLVAVVGHDGVVRVVSSRSGRVLSQCALPRRERALRVAWGPWPRHVASTHDGGLAVVWDLETEIPVRACRVAGRRAEAVAFSNDGRWLAGAGERRVRIYDSDGRQVRDLSVLPDVAGPGDARPLRAITGLAFTPDDRQVVIAGDDGVVRRMDVHGRTTASWRHPTTVQSMDLAPDRLATGSLAGRVSVWSWDGGLLHRSEHGLRINHVAMAPGSSLLATSAADRTLCTWYADGRLATRTALARALVGMRFAVDGSVLMTIDEVGQIDVWAPVPQEAKR